MSIYKHLVIKLVVSLTLLLDKISGPQLKKQKQNGPLSNFFFAASFTQKPYFLVVQSHLIFSFFFKKGFQINFH